jgi:uncharacterized membrane protein
MDMAARQDFENRFFDQLEEAVREVRGDIRKLTGKVDKNTELTNSVINRVDKLDGKVFGKRPSSLANIFGDRQIIGAFIFALLVFLLIVASILHVRIPAL